MAVHALQPRPITLPSDEVHVWYLHVDQVTEPTVLATFEDVLSSEERSRWKRFVFAEKQREFLIAHGFSRILLSCYVSQAPADWRFVVGSHGKPQVIMPPEQHPGRQLAFNLTHTHGLVACALTWDREVGVDAEDWHRQGRGVSELLIQRCLSVQEQACFLSLPPAEQQASFFDYWTLKEAYLKARGFGLSLPIEEITFFWPEGTPHLGRVGIAFGEGIADEPSSWQFARFEPGTQHKISVAVRCPGSQELPITLHDFQTHFCVKKRGELTS